MWTKGISSRIIKVTKGINEATRLTIRAIGINQIFPGFAVQNGMIVEPKKQSVEELIQQLILSNQQLTT